jgi:hypothetical protein
MHASLHSAIASPYSANDGVRCARAALSALGRTGVDAMVLFLRRGVGVDQSPWV